MSYKDALFRFLEALSNREVEHKKKNFPNLKPETFIVHPGRLFDKVVSVRHGENIAPNSQYVYCFVRKSDGAIIKPASWKAPEPKKYERGNIYRINPLEGTNVYGVDYIFNN